VTNLAVWFNVLTATSESDLPL